MEIRAIRSNELQALLELYMQLHGNAMPELTPDIEAVWDSIQADANHHILAGVLGGNLICSCVLVIIPNLTQRQRPYALIENVITHEKYRGRGYGTSMLAYAKGIAEQKACYKIMLMTGAREESTLRFYENAGYNRHDKTAFIQWL